MGNLYRFRGPARGELIHAALTALGTSLLFVTVYGGCSWLTAQRGDVGTWVYGWERYIPFVPLMIISIGFSTVLTWQHHVADVAGGFVLALLCFHFVRRPAPAMGGVNIRVGLYYLCGAGLLSAAALAPGGRALVLLWPALGLALAAGAYFGWTADPFGKQNGRQPLSSRFLLAPLLLGHWLSLRHYQRRADPWNEVVPGLWMGRRLNEREACRAVRRGVTAVLDLTAEFSEPAAFRAVSYLNLPVTDLTAPGPEALKAAVAFIQRERARGTVYVHCKIGYSRSAAVVGAYLRAAGIAPDPDDAIARMRRARPSLVVRPEAERAIALWTENLAAEGIQDPIHLSA